MNRFVVGALSVGLALALIAVSVLAAQMVGVRQELDQLRADARSQARGQPGAYPLVVEDRAPNVSFSDEQALAEYVVRLHDDVESLSSALERDIHAGGEAGQAAFANTHAVIDGADTPSPRPASDVSKEFLGYHE